MQLRDRLQAEQQLARARCECQDLMARTQQAEEAAKQLRVQAAHAAQLRGQLPHLQQLADLQVRADMGSCRAPCQRICLG